MGETFDIMIDLETLGTRPDAMLIQIGAVFFEPKYGGKILNGQAFDRHLIIQDGAGSIDHSTLCFWLTDPHAKEMGKKLATEAVPLSQALEEFIDWPEQHGQSWQATNGVWANPIDFDLPILKSAFNKFGQDVPWNRRATRDTRTVYSLIGGRPAIDWTGFTPHDAVDDCIGQCMQLQKAFGILEGKED